MVLKGTGDLSNKNSEEPTKSEIRGVARASETVQLDMLDTYIHNIETNTSNNTISWSGNEIPYRPNVSVNERGCLEAEPEKRRSCAGEMNSGKNSARDRISHLITKGASQPAGKLWQTRGLEPTNYHCRCRRPS